jgi:hypothetical protein
MCSANQVGDVGAQALGDALKVNTTLTTFYLHSMLRVCVIRLSRVSVCVCVNVDDAVFFFAESRH